MSQAQIIVETSFNRRRRFWVYHFPVLFYAAAIFWASSSSTVLAPDLGFDLQDKLYHVMAYALLGFLLARSSRAEWGPGRRVFLLSMLAVVLYGVSDEWHQAHVPGRFADIYDVMADAVGGIIGHGLYRLAILLAPRRKRIF